MERNAKTGLSKFRCLLARLANLPFQGLLLLLLFASNVYAAGSYTITATAIGGGTITPQGSVSVKSGGNQTFTIRANTGYDISAVEVDASPQGAISSYQFTNVKANHAITAYFTQKRYTITGIPGTGGNINPSFATVYYGGSQTFTVTPTTGYHITDLAVDGASQGAISSYTFSNVTATHSISASFAINTFTLTATAGTGGAISPTSSTTSYGGKQTFTMIPTAGYHVTDVAVDGVSQGAISSYTFSNVTATHSISASFAINTYTITATAGTGGTISPKSSTANYGENQTFTITPDSGYSIANVMIDGVPHWGITSYTFTNIADSHTISVLFTSGGPSQSSSSSYFYDDLGRLTRVMQGNTGVIYAYDEVGNLLSTSSVSTVGGAPSITAIVPNILLAGSKMLVTLSGQNLLLTDSITSGTGLVQVNGIEVVDDTKIVVDMTALAIGTDTINVTQRGGASTSVDVTVITGGLSLSPTQLALAPAETGTLTATITPAPGVPITVNLNNSAPKVLAVPQTVTIPSGGSVTFTVNALQNGVANLDSGGRVETVVFVTAPFSGTVSGLSTAGISVQVNVAPTSIPQVALPVSVRIADVPGAAATSGLPISVRVLPTPGAAPMTAPPVSVSVGAPTGTTPIISNPLSVQIQ